MNNIEKINMLKSKLVDELSKLIPGMFPLLNMVAQSMYNTSFEDLFINEPAKAYNVLKHVLGDEVAADYFIQVLVKNILKGKADMSTIAKIVKEIKLGAKESVLKQLNV